MSVTETKEILLEKEERKWYVIFTESAKRIYLIQTLYKTSREKAAKNGIVGYRTIEPIPSRNSEVDIAEAILNNLQYWGWHNRRVDSLFEQKITISPILFIKVIPSLEVMKDVIIPSLEKIDTGQIIRGKQMFFTGHDRNETIINFRSTPVTRIFVGIALSH